MSVKEEILYIDSDYERYQRVLELDKDTLKLDCLPLIKSESYRAFVIASLKSDKEKISFLKDGLGDHSKYLIVKSLKDEYLRYLYIPLIQSEDFRVTLISSLSVDEYKEELLNSIISVYLRAQVITTFKSDTLKKKYLDEFNEASLARVVASLSNDVDKYEYLNRLVNEDAISLVVNSFISDEYIFLGLNKLSNEELKIVAISKMKSFKNMAVALEMIKDYSIKLCITDYLDSDTKKKELVKYLHGRIKVDLIASLSSVLKKQEYLQSIDNSFYRMIILISLPDKEKEKYIMKLSNYEEKMALIYSLQNKNRREWWIKIMEKQISFDLGIDPSILFGLEIEVEGINHGVIEKSDFGEDNYQGTFDGTLIQSLELKTPKLSNCVNSLNSLYYIFNMLHYAGFSSSWRCGGHIHFDAGYLTKKQEYLALFELWGSCEKIFYLISNPSGELPRRDATNFAMPLFKSLDERLKDGSIYHDLTLTDDEFVGKIHSWQDSKNNSLNLIHVRNGMNTIEFRISNGSNSFVTWMQNIALFARLLMVSKRLGGLSSKEELSGVEQNFWNLKELLKLDLREEEKLEILLDLLFGLDARKEVYRARYYANKELLAMDEKHPLNQLELSRVRKI